MDCPKTTMVLSVGWPAVWAFSGATFSAVTPAPTTKTASSKTNLDTVNPYSRSLRMFPPATSAPSLTHARPENHSPPCSPRVDSSSQLTRSEEHTSELQSRLHLACR